MFLIFPSLMIFNLSLGGDYILELKRNYGYIALADNLFAHTSTGGSCVSTYCKHFVGL